MLEDPEFKIALPNIVTTEFLENVQNTKVLEFIKGEGGYFTLDFSATEEIKQGAVWHVEGIAYTIREKGILQCIGVGKNVWYLLINTRIEEERLISWAEIYTKKSLEHLLGFFGKICKYASRLGITVADIDSIKRTYQQEFERLHGSRQDYDGFGDYDLKSAEFQVITAQRLVEAMKRDADISAHLCYHYGDIENIRLINQIPDFLTGPIEKEVPLYEKYPEGSRCRAICKDWYETYGFLELEDGVDVFVHFSNIATTGFKELRKGRGYEFTMRYGKKGPTGLNVTSLQNT